jgi:ATP-dependent Clp protease protease subunit
MDIFSSKFYSDKIPVEDKETEKPEEKAPEAQEEEPCGDEGKFVLSSGFWGPEDLKFYGKGSRSLLLIGEINASSAAIIISQLFELTSQDPLEPINIHLNTPGGVLSDGLAIHDIINILPAPIAVTVTGQCSSAGLLVLAAADVKLALPNALFYYHPIQSYHSLIGSREEADANYEMYKYSLERYNECVRTGCGINKRNWRKHFDGVTSKYIYADEAIEIGLLDEIVQPIPAGKNK